MNPRARLLLAVALLAVGAIVAVAITQTKPEDPSTRRTALPTQSVNCITPKPPIKVPSWFPTDLPMPPGSYPIEVPREASGYRRVVYAAKGTLRDFVVFALSRWKQRGWSLGRGESEPGEAEDNFLKRPNRYGIFRAQTVFCDPNMTWVLVVVNDPKYQGQPTPSFYRLNPSATPSTLR